MKEALRRQIAAAVGTSGMRAGDTVHPANVTQLREVLAASAAAGVAVTPAASPGATGSAVVVDVDRLDAILVDPTTLLAEAGAAATWAAIRQAVGTQRLAVSALPSVRSERVGDSIARGEIAHRTLAGVQLLTPAGELITAGGRTLKDVVGYDLAGLALGSGQRLGLIVSVTLRLDPAEARVDVEPGPGPWRDDVVDVASAFAG